VGIYNVFTSVCMRDRRMRYLSCFYVQENCQSVTLHLEMGALAHIFGAVWLIVTSVIQLCFVLILALVSGLNGQRAHGLGAHLAHCYFGGYSLLLIVG
jgi:hypothetical protein